MNAQELVPYLGKTAESQDVTKLLARFGVKKQPRMKRDEIDATVDLEPQGLVLLFRPADDKSSQLKLAEVQIYSDMEEGFTSFGGQLPRGLTFADSRADAIKKLGKPDLSRRQFRLETWYGNDSTLTVKFAKGEGRIQMLHLGLAASAV